MNNLDPTICPKGHEHRTPIPEVLEDFMPDYVYQLWYCHECERTHEVVYRPASIEQLERPD